MPIFERASNGNEKFLWTANEEEEIQGKSRKKKYFDLAAPDADITEGKKKIEEVLHYKFLFIYYVCSRIIDKTFFVQICYYILYLKSIWFAIRTISIVFFL